MYKHTTISYSNDFLSAKEVLAYLLIFIYLVAACKPVIPMAADMLAHTFWESNHIETIHHKHGPHHLKSEIAKSEKDDTNNSNNIIKLSEPVALHLLSTITYSFTSALSKIQHLPSGLYSICSTALDKNYPPPKSY